MSFNEGRKSLLEEQEFGFKSIPHSSDDPSIRTSKRCGCPIAYVATAFVGVGGALFGYDIGIISGVLVMNNFIKEFSDKVDTDGSPLLDDWTKSFIVTVFIAGNFVGAIGSNQVADRYGRRSTLSIGSLIFLFGGVLQCLSANLWMLFVGRVIAGLAIGLLTAVVPLFNSELAPPEVRGRLITFNQISMTGGIMVAFWVNYALQDYENGWRYALGGQVVPALVLLVGSYWMPRSPRWLVHQGLLDPLDGQRWIDEARQVLTLLREDSTMEQINEEIEDIKDAIAIEWLKPPTWMGMMSPGLNRRRVIIAVIIQSGQNLTGINAIMYYAPDIFKSMGFADSDLLAQGINGVVNWLATFVAFYVVDKYGRRSLLLIGGCCMAICMALIATLGFVYASTDSDGKITIDSKVVGYTCIISIYLYVISFAYSWGPVCWLLPTEIFPLSQRAKGVSLTTGANFLWNFIVGQFTPWALTHMHWGLFYVFAFCLVSLCIFVYLELPETKGVHLEQIAQLFEPGTDWRAQREVFAEGGTPKRSHKSQAMPTSASYDDLLSAGVEHRKPSHETMSQHESILNPGSR